ncbi:MAG: hypothetical protein CK536_08670 [Synechococcus sp. Baikal-G1]|nr:MAG: hypothetical protein CK536_08670 [Synechococcus sp. Baikal-G1]
MGDQAEGDQRELAAIQRQLADSRQQIGELEALIGELPGIYERKFEHQLQPLLEQERLLRQQNVLLRDQLHRALPGAASPLLLAPGQPPGRWPARHRLALGAAALAALGAFGLVQRQWAPANPQRNPAPLGANQLAAQAGGPARAKELLVITSGPSWIELRDAQGRTIYGGLLDGRQRFRLGAGLSLKAGRPELVQVQLGGGPAQALPPGEWWSWHRFQPPGS